MDIETKLRAIMKKANKNQGDLADALGVSQPTVHRWLKGSEPEGHRRDQINALYEEAFGGDADKRAVVKLVGEVGAGAEIMPDYEQVPPEGLELVQVEIPLPGGMVCFRVKGNSMRPQFRNGQVIIVYAEQKRPLEFFYGLEAVVRTSDGRRFIKTVERGTTPGTVDLISWNADPIKSQRLDWIGEIYAILPESAVISFDREHRRNAG